MSLTTEKPAASPPEPAVRRPGIFSWFAPAPHVPPLSAPEVERKYPRERWRVFEAAFIAYAAFYLVRNNFAPVSKEVGEALHYDEDMIGNILGYSSLAYGLGKFVMGYLADRSDARKYMAAGLLMTAVINFLFGASHTYHTHLFLWTLNGFVQGMGYGPCTRGLSHWYSVRERGTVFGFWNVSHNVGGGIAGALAAGCAKHYGWPSAFFVPGIICCALAVYLFFRMRDTPQSVGLPPVEKFKNDYPPEETESHERDLTTREIMLQYIFPNRLLWILALANIFVYIARYALVDWGPTFLKTVHHASLVGGGSSTTVIEFVGALGMLSMGWISDKWGGLRARVSVLSMLPLLLAFPAVIYAPKGMLWLEMVLFGVIGFFVYTPVLFSGVISLDLTTKKAVGTAAGFVGCFGYIGRFIESKGIGWIAKRYGWDPALWAVFGATVIAIILLSLLWKVRPRG